ncbi:hypothetical protein HaLaN_05919 [Haematococcus lacustris]|uniref:Uncharacterized protein n=1 Tax=Haematococcus lacustris TaxID=44745 RepID=A0A699Z569_HAELA|nr:hypothetical protein HaLaN_05919 [Haematococcus lacustris]
MASRQQRGKSILVRLGVLLFCACGAGQSSAPCPWAEAEQEQQEQQEEGGLAQDPMLADEQPTEQQAHVADEVHEPDQEQHDLQASDADAVPDSALANVHGPHDPDMDLPLHLRQPLAGAASSPSHPNHQEQQQDGAVLNPATHQDAADPMAEGEEGGVEGEQAMEGDGGGGEWHGNGLLNTEEVDDKGDGEGEEQDGQVLPPSSHEGAPEGSMQTTQCATNSGQRTGDLVGDADGLEHCARFNVRC